MNWIKSVKEIIGGIILAIAIPILIIFTMATMVVTTTFPLMELSPNKILIGYFIGIAICILMILGAYFLLREKKEEKPKRFKLRFRYLWIVVLLYNFGIHGAVGAYEFFREYPLTFFFVSFDIISAMQIRYLSLV